MPRRGGLADLNQPGTGVPHGARVWADYDNSGYESVLIYKWGRPELYHNDGGKHFTRVTQEKAGLPKWVNANMPIWLDYDGDGKVDLLICGYWPDELDLWHLKRRKDQSRRELRVAPTTAVGIFSCTTTATGRSPT